MASFPVEDYLASNGIPHYRGSFKGINIDCPYCPGGDTGKNCGLFTDDRLNFSCWKCGRSGHLYEILNQLTSISWSEFKHILNTQDVFVGHDVDLPRGEKETFEFPQVPLPIGSVPVTPQLLAQIPVLAQYIESRQLPLSVYQRHKVHFCMLSKYSGRLIIPIMFKGKCVGFQGRDVTGNKNVPKYLASDNLKTNALLYNFDNFRGNGLVLVEGVFDAWTLGDCAVACFKSYVSPEQTSLIIDLKPKAVYIAFDADVWDNADKIKNIKFVWGQLASFISDVYAVKYPEGQDPNSMGPVDCWMPFQHAIKITESFLR